MKRIFSLIIIIAVVLLPSCINLHITQHYYGDKLDNSIIDLITKDNEKEETDIEENTAETTLSDTENDVPNTEDTELSPEENTDESQTPSVSLRITSLTSPLSPNQTATIEVIGKPFTEYNIDVIYSTAPSSAKGLENKISDENGIVSWSWKIGPSVKPGSYEITVVGGTETAKTQIQIN